MAVRSVLLSLLIAAVTTLARAATLFRLHSTSTLSTAQVVASCAKAPRVFDLRLAQVFHAGTSQQPQQPRHSYPINPLENNGDRSIDPSPQNQPPWLTAFLNSDRNLLSRFHPADLADPDTSFLRVKNFVHAWDDSDASVYPVTGVAGALPEWSKVSKRKLQRGKKFKQQRNKGGTGVQEDEIIHVFEKDIMLPNATDPLTVLQLAKMTSNSYSEPDGPGWVDIPPFNLSDRFGWTGDGIRGYVFSDPSKDLVVIALKGTSLSAPIVGGGPTAPRDKFNDNLMFSCCCGKVSSSWTGVCECADSNTHSCDMGCLYNAASYSNSYFNLANTIYMAVSLWYPSTTNIWLTGHSLGGALASLVGLTHDLPVFAYEAPGDFLYASRIGLIPDLPPNDTVGDETAKKSKQIKNVGAMKAFGYSHDSSPEERYQQPLIVVEPMSKDEHIDSNTDVKTAVKKQKLNDLGNSRAIPDYSAFLETLEIYHIGNWKDPIYMGECLSSGSLCWISGYALESKCHAGKKCVYEGAGPGLDMRYHSIDRVISDFLTKLEPVPECKAAVACDECGLWTWK